MSFRKEKRIDEKFRLSYLYYLNSQLVIHAFFLRAYCKAMKLNRGTNLLFMHVLFLRECFILKYHLYSKLLDFFYVFLLFFESHNENFINDE